MLWLRPASVFRDHRTAPTIVDARGDEIDVLTDAVVARDDANRGSNRGEVEITAAHEQVIIFDTGRPVRRKTELDTGSDRAAEAGFSRPVKHRASKQTFLFVVGKGPPAFHIPNHFVPA